MSTWRQLLMGSALMGLPFSTAPAQAGVTFATQFVLGTPYFYGSSASVTQALGTVPDASSIASGVAGTGGGLCLLDTSNSSVCPPPLGNITAGILASGGTGSGSASGIISFTTPGSPGENFLLTIKLTDASGFFGDIWDVVLNGKNIGTTRNVSLSASGGTTGAGITAIVQGDQTYSLSITDLMMQYQGQTDLFGGGTINHTSTVFLLSTSIADAPEPGSSTVFLGALAALTAVRRRRAC